MARVEKVAGAMVCGLAAGAFALLGAWWIVDRTRRWETPRADPGLFSVVRDGPATDVNSRGLALVPVNPGCPHCLRSLRALGDSCRGEDRCADLVVLLVDQDRRPPRSLADSLGVARLWWDRRGIWRRRWGHRIYGEVLRFDPFGRYLGTSPPLVAP